MAVETLYADAPVSGTVAGADNVVGAPNGTWTTTTGNSSYLHRWAMANPVQTSAADGTHTITVRAKKEAGQSGTPKISIITIYQGGTVLHTVTTGWSITSTTGQDVSISFPGNLITSPNDIDVEINVSSAGGSPSARTTVQIDAITWTASFAAPAVPIMYQASGTLPSLSAVSGNAVRVPAPVTHRSSGTVSVVSTVAGALSLRAFPNGSVPVISTTSGSATLIPGPVTWQAEASVQALTKSSGSAALKRPASGSTDIQSTSSGTSILRAASAGANASVTTVSGSAELVPAPVWQASGTVQVLSGVQGDADRATMRYQASGAVEVLSTVSGTTTSRGVVSGTAASSSSVSGAVTVRSFPTGSVSSTTQITGAPTSRRYPTGTVQVATAVSDQAVARHYLAGTSEVVSTVSGAPMVKGAPVHPASGTIYSSSSASGSVTSLLPSTGIFEVQTDAQGTATARHMPQGSVFVTTGTSGSPMAILTPTGVVPVLSQSQGEVTAWLYPSGQIEVLSSVSGSPVARTGAVYAASGEVSVLTSAQGTVYLKFLMHQQAMGTVNIKTWTVGEANEVMSVAAIVTAESLVSGAPVLKSPLQQEVVSVTSSVSGKAYIPTTQSWFIYENGVEVPLVFEGRMETGSLTPGELFPR